MTTNQHARRIAKTAPTHLRFTASAFAQAPLSPSTDAAAFPGNTTIFLNGNGGFTTPAGGGGSPGCTPGQIQFNNNGAFGGVTAVPIGNGGINTTIAQPERP